VSETLAETEARAVGVVTTHKSRRTYSAIDNRPEVLFFPSVGFQTAYGRTVEFENDLGSNAPPRVGDEVTVLYDPARPEEAKVALRSMWRVDPKALLVVGAIFVGAMAFFYLFFVAVIVWVSLA
jgi:uncharacterized protein DUF3592